MSKKICSFIEADSPNLTKTGKQDIRHSVENKKLDSFLKRHIGPSETETSEILKSLKISSLEKLTDKILPQEINRKKHILSPSSYH